MMNAAHPSFSRSYAPRNDEGAYALSWAYAPKICVELGESNPRPSGCINAGQRLGSCSGAAFE